MCRSVTLSRSTRDVLLDIVAVPLVDGVTVAAVSLRTEVLAIVVLGDFFATRPVFIAFGGALAANSVLLTGVAPVLAVTLIRRFFGASGVTVATGATLASENVLAPAIAGVPPSTASAPRVLNMRSSSQRIPAPSRARTSFS